MSFEISKIYTENPYVDEMVYYTKTLAMGTVLKMQQQADDNETLESLKQAGIYISAIEGTATIDLYPSISISALTSAGIVDSASVNYYLSYPNKLPEDKKALVVKAMNEEFISNYVEMNSYYRMLHGLPALGQEDYVTDWIPPDGINIDLSKPIHEMDNSEVLLLDRYGVLDRMMKEDPKNRQYMRFLGKKKIDYYLARKSQRFDPLYVPTVDSDAIEKMYKDRLDENKFYVLRTVYSEAYKYDSAYYDNFIAIFIVLITMIDIISRVQEFITRKEIFDTRSVEYIFRSNGIPFFESIPLKYQISMVKNLHNLLKYKSTSKCMVDICSLFGFNNIKIFKYYLLRDRNIDLTTGEYVTATDEDGNEDLEKEYTLKFLKLPLEDDLNDYIRSGTNYLDYDEVVSSDSKWDGDLDHEEVLKNILKEEFNFSRTKYISIDTIYEIAKMSAQQSYFFNMLFDNIELEDAITVQIPYIEAGKNFRVSDVFTLLTVLTYYYYGVKDTIMDTQSKVLYVNGFNFKADLAALAEDMKRTGSTLHAQEQLKSFKVPESNIPSFNELMDLYVNNMAVRDELIKGMREADNKRVYDVYKNLYDSLMTLELTFDYYKNPETGDFYRDDEGDATYTEFLKHRDNSLYYTILNIQDFEDEASRNQYIGNLIDSIIYVLEEFIDTKEFQGLFSNLPVMSTESVKQYIATVINFYKSYKVDFLGMNTIYTLDDELDSIIQIIDDMELNHLFDKREYIELHEYFAKNNINISPSEKIRLHDRIYLDIRTWANKRYDDRIAITDELYEKITRIILYTILGFKEDIRMVIKKSSNEYIKPLDFINTSNIVFTSVDELGIKDSLWINEI